MKLTTTSAPFHPGTPWELFRFETPELGAGGDPGAGVVDPPADPGLSDPLAGAADPDPSAAAPGPAAPTWGPDSPEFLAAVDDALGLRLGALQQQEPPYAGHADPGFEIDPFSDDFGPTLIGAFGQMLEQALEQRLGPIERDHTERLVDQGRAESMQTFASFQDLGEFDHDQAFTRAQDIYTGLAQQFGVAGAERFTGHALRQAAEQQRQFEQRIEERAIARYRGELEAAAGRPGGAEPPVSGGAHRPTEQADSYDAVTARYEARHRHLASQV